MRSFAIVTATLAAFVGAAEASPPWRGYKAPDSAGIAGLQRQPARGAAALSLPLANAAGDVAASKHFEFPRVLDGSRASGRN